MRKILIKIDITINKNINIYKLKYLINYIMFEK